MAGFAGYLLSEPQELGKNEKIQLTEMVNVISHRGSNDSDLYTDDYIRLGFQNLHTTTTVEGHQPLSYENDRYWIVFDGDIYNYLELREQLEKKGYVFQTESDTEVLLALYADRQEKALNDLRGTYSFVIWDKQEKELFGARDPLGIKPFYYMEKEAQFYFASEMKSLYLGEPNKVNPEALQYYFAFQYVPEPHTMQEKIRKLQPGFFFKKNPGQPTRTTSFAELKFSPKDDAWEDRIQKIQDTLRESVRLHMQGNQTVGAFLSGGVDSSAIVALAKEVDPTIKTFTVGFKREGFSEIDVAKETAAQLDVENHHYVITVQEFIDELPNVIKYMDDPMADPAAVPLYFVAREAKKQVQAVLSGEGADELFGGYNIYREPGDLKVFDYIPKTVQSMLKKLAYQVPKGVRGKSFIERGTTPLKNRFIGNAKLFSETDKKSLLKDYQSNFNSSNITRPLYDKAFHYPKVQKMQYIDIHTWLRGDILVKADRMSMAHGLELRSPFLDKEVFKEASKLSPEEMIANKTTKYALREAMRGIVPDSVLYNKKLGFPVPIRHWLKDELFNWATDIIENSQTDHLINKAYVLNLLEIHQSGKLDYAREIWAVLIFMIWYEQIYNPLFNIKLNEG